VTTNDRDFAAAPDPDDRLGEVAPGYVSASSGDGGSWWSRPVFWITAAVVVVVALVAGVVLVVGGGGTAAAGEVFLEPAVDDGADPFFASVATTAVAVDAGGVDEIAGSSDGVESLSGATPGLYGGTGDDAVCDPQALVAFLEGDPTKAAAFASVLGIAPADIDSYVSALTPVLLREDTRVTNHGFTNGVATARQAVFQAGTAVLIDDLGVPRVRCACGNPLTEPQATGTTPAYQGTQWTGFDTTRLVAVNAAPQPQTTFDLINVTTGQPYTTPAATGDELVLAPDGLGIVTFGQPGEQVRAVLTEHLGEPDDVFECAPPQCGNHDPQGLHITWGGLTVYISANSGAFEYYNRGGEWDPATQTMAPIADPPAATAEGITIGSTTDDLFAAYPGLQHVVDCDYESYEPVLVPATPDANGSLITGLDGYKFLVESGGVTGISHDIDGRFITLECGP
jgi:hypothetical protein